MAQRDIGMVMVGLVAHGATVDWVIRHKKYDFVIQRNCVSII